LVVDDDDTFRSRLVRALRARGFDTTGASSYDEAIACVRRESPEYALIDLRLGTASGLDLIREMKELDTTTTIVVLTGYGSIATAVRSVKLGASSYLTKPVDADQIAAAFDAPDAASSADSAGRRDAVGVVQPLARVEWEHIQRVLADCGGNVSQAARLLGLHRRSLQRKLSKYPVPEHS
jgi:two-component system response regulator RegA